MKTRSVRWGVAVLILVTAGACVVHAQAVSKGAAPARSPTNTDQRLDAILANQAAMLEKLQAIQDELQTVKVRCTH